MYCINNVILLDCIFCVIPAGSEHGNKDPYCSIYARANRNKKRAWLFLPGEDIYRTTEGFYFERLIISEKN